MSNREPQESSHFKRFKRKAEKVVKDNEQLKGLVKDVKDKIDSLPIDGNAFQATLNLIKAFVRMIKAYVKKEYTEVPWKTLILIVAALLYFIFPLDVIPDFIPITGLMDDSLVLLWVGKSVKEDLKRFQEWEQVGGTSNGDLSVE
ncbi:MAG: YkvA family protein [Bacteroidota bacterium]